jgi:pimeloyl-ACP methyl ester carboxylesterase
VLEQGSPGDPVIIFLHGFPEAAVSWEFYLETFAAKGFYALAPDQRGYGRSEKPKGISSYTIEWLVEDLRQLIVQVADQPVVLVGHDWGGVVAWHFADQYPQLLRQLVVINIPHPEVFRQTLLTSNDQRKRSTYIAWFQLPLLPEFFISAFRFASFRKMLRKTAKPGTFNERQLTQYLFNWQQSNAIQSMLNWYRAFRFSKAKAGIIRVPALILFGKRDAFLRWQMGVDSCGMCTNARLQLWDDATHWLHHEYREAVAHTILESIQKSRQHANLPTE